MLRAELFARGLKEQDVTDIDIMLRNAGLMLHRKIISANQPELVADSIVEQPLSALLSGSRILVYQQKPDRSLSYRTEPGDIVITAVGPAAQAAALNIEVPTDALGKDLAAAL
ncbi:hypothetical protein [Halochromatium sp.]